MHFVLLETLYGLWVIRLLRTLTSSFVIKRQTKIKKKQNTHTYTINHTCARIIIIKNTQYPEL
jgi:hypothetical protein